jgi:hypothetical protein
MGCLSRVSEAGADPEHVAVGMADVEFADAPWLVCRGMGDVEAVGDAALVDGIDVVHPDRHPDAFVGGLVAVGAEGDRAWIREAGAFRRRCGRDVLKSREGAERALVALRTILSELGLTLKDAKTRIVELREGGEGLDFLGFHHRWVRGTTPRSRHLRFLVRWPSRQAMGRARGRIRELTDRRRLREPVEDVVQDINGFLRGWAGYFRYGNSAQSFDKISLHAINRLSIFIANRQGGHAGLADGSLHANHRTGWA